MPQGQLVARSWLYQPSVARIYSIKHLTKNWLALACNFAALGAGIVMLSAGLPAVAMDTWFAKDQGIASHQACLKTFPNGLWIKRKFGPGENRTFQLFVTSAKPFAPNKKTVLFIDGGPGGVVSQAGVEERAKLYPEFNLIAFHPRGGGCSGFPEDKEYDRFLTTPLASEDIEAIRQHFGIQKFASLHGESYGTVLASTYAHFYPENVDQLYLLAPGIPSGEPESGINFELIKKMLKENRARPNSYLSQLSDEYFKQFESYFSALTRICSATCLYDVAFSPQEEVKTKLYNLMKSGGLPDALANRIAESHKPLTTLDTVFAPILLAYMGDTMETDMATGILLNNWALIGGSEPFSDWLQRVAQQLRLTFHSSDAPDFDSAIVDHGYVADRLIKRFNSNDSSQHFEDICHSVPMTVVQGEYDQATPVKDFEGYLVRPKCFSGQITRIIVKSAGHGTGYPKCVDDTASAIARGEYIQAGWPCKGTTLELREAVK